MQRNAKKQRKTAFEGDNFNPIFSTKSIKAFISEGFFYF